MERVPFMSVRYLCLKLFACPVQLTQATTISLVVIIPTMARIYCSRSWVSPQVSRPGTNITQPPDTNSQAHHQTAPQFHTYIKIPISQISATVPLPCPNRQEGIYCSITPVRSIAASPKSASLPTTLPVTEIGRLLSHS
jgi:hypothetical protein